MTTKGTSAKEITRTWHHIDVKEKVLGRIAGEIAALLIGKRKATHVPYLDGGDYVVVTSAKEVVATGRKELQKKYYKHSGYPGGFKQETLKELRERRPEDIIRHAVKGMLPQNKLRDRMLTRLFIFAGTEHTFGDKFKVKS